MKSFVVIALAGTLVGAQLVSAQPAAPEPQSPAQPPPAAGAIDETETGTGAPGALPTPTDQHEDEGDLRITQHIRQSLIAADDLSWKAKNVTVVTQDGRVTLRGPVATADEKQRIGALAQSTTGVVRVRNELEVQRD